MRLCGLPTHRIRVPGWRNGRRGGLKNRWGETLVRVQFPGPVKTFGRSSACVRGESSDLVLKFIAVWRASGDIGFRLLDVLLELRDEYLRRFL
jgi:hypothetical protein